MKIRQKYIKLAAALLVAGVLSSCEKALDEVNYDQFTETTFYKTAEDAKLAVTAVYASLNPDGYSIWGCGLGGIVPQSSFTTDELICSWGWSGWPMFNALNLTETFPSDALFVFYNNLMPTISNATVVMDKIANMDITDTKVKDTYVGELKALRAHYSWILYSYYGPVPIRVDAAVAADPNAEPIARPTKDEMVAQIEKDYKEALEVLPLASELASSDYGRFTKDACLMGLIKLYMQEKRWNDVITYAHQLQQLGHSLKSNYADIFTYENNGDHSEVIFAVNTRMDAYSSNMWLAHALPGNYADPSGQSLTQWGGYKMPWAVYDKFDNNDKRKERLLASWKTSDGSTFDARANNYIGAIPMKYGVDPNATSEKHGVNIIVWRYADVLLSLAEAINEVSGPTTEAYELVDQVRTRAGLEGWSQDLTQDEFRTKLKDERLFEFWCEGGIRREDLIRWGTYVDRAIEAGSQFAKPEFVLWPIPRKVINETNGVVKQNPGYN